MSTPATQLLAIRDLAAAGRTDQAIAACRRLLQKHPNHAEGNHSLAVLLYRAGQHEQSLYYIQQTIKAAPTIGDYHATHARILLGLKRRHDAADALRRAVEVQPANARHRLDLQPLLWEQGDYQGSLDAAREAARLAPGDAHARNNLIGTLSNTGDVEEALRLTIAALQAQPTDSSLLAILSTTSNYSPSLSAAAITDAHIRHGRAVTAATAPLPPLPKPGPDQADRRLRIGYLSPDLYTHSVAYFLEPILAHHDRAGFEPIVYSIRPNLDDTTRRLMALVGGEKGGWRDLGAVDEEAIVQRIRADKIDILVDLAGLTGPNQLWLMARKAAPIQVTAIGYPNTTGLPAIDYRIIDSITDPPGSECLATETLLRLDPCFLCYSIPPDAPDPEPPPSVAAGHVTFGSFNNCIKLSAPVLSLWSRILAAVPDSRLVLKSIQFKGPLFRDKYQQRCVEAGIDPARLDLVGRIESTSGHLGAYARLDIALDPFPYNGTTTTCEALAMGVPVVTLAGDRHASRVGASLLSAAGLPDLVATSQDDYLGIATALAADPGRLASLRTGLRPQLAASSLCDCPAYARRLEAAYRAMWRRRCAPA